MSSISAVITPPYFKKPMEMPRKPEKPPKDATNKPQHISQPPRRPPEPPQTVTIIATPSATTTAPPSPRAQAYDSKESKLDKMTENSSDEHQEASEEPRTPCGITYDIQRKRTYESQNDPVFPQMVQKQMFLPQKPSNTSTSLLMTSSTPTRAQTSKTIPISPPAPSPAPKPPETSSIHSISSPTPSSHPFSAISSQILAILFALYFFRHSRHFKPAFKRFHSAVLKIQSPIHQSNLHPFSVTSSQILPFFLHYIPFVTRVISSPHSSDFIQPFSRYKVPVIKATKSARQISREPLYLSPQFFLHRIQRIIHSKSHPHTLNLINSLMFPVLAHTHFIIPLSVLHRFTRFVLCSTCTVKSFNSITYTLRFS